MERNHSYYHKMECLTTSNMPDMSRRAKWLLLTNDNDSRWENRTTLFNGCMHGVSSISQTLTLIEMQTFNMSTTKYYCCVLQSCRPTNTRLRILPNDFPNIVWAFVVFFKGRAQNRLKFRKIVEICSNILPMLGIRQNFLYLHKNNVCNTESFPAPYSKQHFGKSRCLVGRVARPKHSNLLPKLERI